MNFITRIQKVTIRNLKNVGYGEIRFTCNMKEDIFEAGSDILGMYGQNGSGKTTLIFALEILSQLTSGKKLWKDANKFIKIGASDATVCYEFSVGYKSGDRFYVRYEVTLKEKVKEEQVEEVTEQSPKSVVYVEKEKLSYRKINGNKGNRFISIIDYDFHKDTIFEPDTRFREFISKDKQLTDELRYMKGVSYKEGSSYIFTIGRINNIRDRQGFSNEMVSVMDAIQMFGMMKLFVLSNVQASIVNANIVLPMIFRFIDKDKKMYRTIMVRIKLTDETLVPQEICNLMAVRFEIIDKVISKLIPNMSLKIANKGNKIGENGETYNIIELISVRDGKEISVRYESDGIKKLIYIMYSLIEMYNDPSVTVAIDELDSGVFEYLLGELLSVLEESAKGQLIFTSHNLRALEVLNKKNVMFSTTNVNNRYIRFKNIKGTNNLRDVYYQDILLGGQDECVYEPTSQNAIRRAFRSAGGDLNG